MANITTGITSASFAREQGPRREVGQHENWTEGEEPYELPDAEVQHYDGGAKAAAYTVSQADIAADQNPLGRQSGR